MGQPAGRASSRRGRSRGAVSRAAGASPLQEPPQQTNQRDSLVEIDSMKGTEAGHTLDKLGLLLEDPTAFVTSAESVASSSRAAAKAIFDLSAAVAAAEAAEAEDEDTAGLSALMLPELHVDGFDTEQIWLQVEMGLDGTLKRCKRLLKRASAVTSGAQLLAPEAADTFGISTTRHGDGTSSEEEGGEEEEEREEQEGGSEEEEEELEDDDVAGASASDDEDAEDQGEDLQEEVASRAKKTKAVQPLKPGEDQFLNFDDMDKFLQDAEDQAARSSDDEEEEDDEEGKEDDEEEEEEDAEEEDGLPLGDGGDSDGSDADLMAALDREASRQTGRKRRAGADNDEGDEDGEEDGMGLMGGGITYEDFFGKKGSKPGEVASARAQGGGGQQQNSAGPSKARRLLGDDDDGDAEEEFLSAFEKQQRKMQQKIQALEQAAVGEKTWDMKGEVSASARPLNSALEADLDFETGVKGAPEVSDETAESIEEMIRKRCMEGNFDDVIRFAAPPPEKKKAVLELDNTKSSAGLGELYEKDFVRATAGGAVEDKDDPIRQEAKQLFGELCGKLDSLSHFHYAPKPVVEELVVKADVPALAMEEALPTAASTANLKAPEETFKASSKRDLKADEELTPGEKKAARAKRKRASRLRKAEKEAEVKSRAAAVGGLAQTLGRKSETEARGVGSRKGSRSEYVKSAGMFSKLQDQQNALKAGIKVPGKEEPKKASASSFKL